MFIVFPVSCIFFDGVSIVMIISHRRCGQDNDDDIDDDHCYHQNHGLMSFGTSGTLMVAGNTDNKKFKPIEGYSCQSTWLISLWVAACRHQHCLAPSLWKETCRICKDLLIQAAEMCTKINLKVIIIVSNIKPLWLPQRSEFDLYCIMWKNVCPPWC